MGPVSSNCGTARRMSVMQANVTSSESDNEYADGSTDGNN